MFGFSFLEQKCGLTKMHIRGAFSIELINCWEEVFTRNRLNGNGPTNYLQVAVALARTRGRVSAWMGGKEVPPTLTFYYIADALNAYVYEVLPEMDALLSRSLCIRCNNRFSIVACYEYVEYVRHHSSQNENDEWFSAIDCSTWSISDEAKSLHAFIVTGGV